MKIKVNKSEYPLIILKDSQIKSRHTDLDIQELKIEITIYAELDMRAMDEILANRILTTLENGSPLKNFYITEHSYISNVNNSRKYFITLLESKFDVIKLNIDGVEFNPYFYEETNSKDGLFGYSKIKTDKKGFDYINQKKFSTDAISVIRLGISNEPIQVRIQSTREWSEINGEYKLIVAFNQFIDLSKADYSIGDLLLKLKNHSIINKTLINSIVNKLIEKEVLNKSDAELIYKEATNNFNQEFIEYHKVKDIELLRA